MRVTIRDGITHRALQASLGGAALALALLVAGDARAEPEPLHPGRDPYLQYCSSCHGPEGRGDGPLAAEMKTAPADLTRLAARYGSPLPKDQLREFVDGRDMPRSHGSSEMPVWGRKLLEGVPPSAGSEAFKRSMIFVILEWLDTIQQQ